MSDLGPKSIRSKLPLMVVSLILLMGALLSTVAFVVIRSTLLETSSDRLTSLSLQFQENFKNTVAANQARYAAAAKRPELAAYLESPSSMREAAALSALRQPLPQPELSGIVSLHDAQGRLLLTTALDNPRGVPPFTGDFRSLPDVPGEARTNGTVTYGKIRHDGDAVWYPVVARIEGPQPGYWVNWRTMGRSSPARTQMAGMLGSSAALYLVNIDGTAWSELGHPLPPPSRPPRIGGVAEYDRADRGTVLAAAQPIPGTPWLFTIEFPTQVVLAPARRFVRTALGIATACIALGMLVAWVMSRRITAPLERLSVAADALAAGDLSQRVDESRDDELGRLARSFNLMAAQVQEARERLERLVEKRTDQLRTAEESLARREKLALVGHLAGGVGHEIRNPLGVMANAIFYLETIQPDAPPEVKEYLGILRQQVDLSAKIVNDLLDLSRTTPANRQPVCVRSVIDDRLRRVSRGTALVKADVPSDLPPVHVDPVHAGQVLDNLLINAVQALEGAPGTVSVRARAADTGFVEIAVSDTGQGIRPENMSKIFEPLFTTKARGIGLGLALSKTLAQANGGDLTLASAAGESATFVLTLPVAGGTA